MMIKRWLATIVLAIILLNVLNELVPRLPPPSQQDQQQQQKQQKRVAFYDKWEQRPYIQTYAAQSEWFIVDAVQVYGKFMEPRPFYDFGYMNVVGSYWIRLAKATEVSIRHSGLYDTTANMYFAMQLFMGVLLSANFAVMGALSFPIRLAIGGAETDQILVTLAIDRLSVDALHHDLALQPPPTIETGTVPRMYEQKDGDGRLDASWLSFHVWWPRYRMLLTQLEWLSRKYPTLTVAAIDGYRQVAVKFAACPDTFQSRLNQSTISFDVQDFYQLAEHDFLIARIPVQQLAHLTRTHPLSPIHPIHIFDF
jgi:hypothetical protein